MGDSTRVNSNEVYVGDAMVKGFEVTYTCKDNFAQAETASTCDGEGRWSPKVVCYPGTSNRNYAVLNVFINLF